MHSPLKMNPHAASIKQQLQQKIYSAKKALKDDKQSIDYCELIYLIAQKSIKLNFVTATLKQKYGDRFQEINLGWKQLKQQQIAEEVSFVKRKNVEENWMEFNISPQRMKTKQQRYKTYEQGSKNKQQARERVKMLKDKLKILSNMIDISKNQQQQLRMRREYCEMMEEYRFITNKQRRKKNLRNQQQCSLALSKSQQKLIEIQQRIREISRQQKRLKSIQAFKYNDQSLQKKRVTPPKQQTDRLKTLEDIFIDYSKKETKQFMLFDEILQNQKSMSLQNYLRLATISGIGSELSLDEKVSIYKQVAQYQSRINFIDFSNILKALCMKQCQKLGLKFKTRILDKFIQQMIKKVNSKKRNSQSNSNMMSNSTNFSSNLREDVSSNYHFKIQGHTGKHKQDIKAFLQQKKRSHKTEASIIPPLKLSQATMDKLMDGRKNTGKSKRLKTFNQDYSSVKRKYTNTFKSSNFGMESEISSKQSRSSLDKQTYTSIFIRKRQILEAVKPREVEEKERREIEEELKTQKATFLTIENKMKESQLLHNDLNEIIELSQDDPFLTSHLTHAKSSNIFNQQ